jgi:hypothetical protein
LTNFNFLETELTPSPERWHLCHTDGKTRKATNTGFHSTFVGVPLEAIYRKEVPPFGPDERHQKKPAI